MFTELRAPAVAVLAILMSLTVGNVSAQELSAPGPISTQLQAKVATTYIVKFEESVNPSNYRRNAASIASRFSGRVVHVYENVLPAFAMRIDGGGGQNLMSAVGQFGIASVARDSIVSINAQSDNRPGSFAKPCRLGGPCPEDPPLDEEPSQPPQVQGWNIERLWPNTEAPDYSGITVCVIDTGVQLHDDLNVAVGSGVNIANTLESAADDNGHGTHVAGIIGAMDNTIGVVGVAPGVRIVPIKVLDSNGSGSFADVLAGVSWAAEADNGCTIANLSLGGTSSSTALDEAIQNAAKPKYATAPDSGKIPGLFFSIAAGNSALDIEVYSYTPARASTAADDNIFTIASIAEDDVWSYYSNYHSEGSAGGRVDFALPGQSILSTWIDQGYNNISGTSMAAPHMAGLLARYIAGSTQAPLNIHDGDFSSEVTLNRTIRVRDKRNIKEMPQDDTYSIIGPKQ
jgi:subtilisin family serine protease